MPQASDDFKYLVFVGTSSGCMEPYPSRIERASEVVKLWKLAAQNVGQVQCKVIMAHFCSRVQHIMY